MKSPFNFLVPMALMAATAAQAAPPVPTSLSPGFTFQQYTDTSTTVGIGQVDVDNVLYYIDEKTAASPFCPVASCKSFLIFFDPATVGTNVQATLQFDAPIVATFGQGLILGPVQLLLTTPGYGANGYTYFPIVFTGPEDVGLETSDFVTVAGNQLTINWTAADPGDHLRVLVAVPEASTSALLAAGLLAVGWLARRRRREPSAGATGRV